MSDSQPVRIDVVSDVVCPWCFIGKRRLEKALALKPDIPVEVHWHPYFLNDWIPREGIARDEYLTTKFGSPERYKGIAQRVSAAAAAEGLTYAIDKINRQPNTLDCHRLIRWADGIGKAAEMKQKLMDLYFTEGADLTDRAVLVQAAADVGLDADDVRARRWPAIRTSRRSSRRRSPPRRPASRACPVHLRRQVRGVRRAGAGISRRGDRARGARPRSGRITCERNAMKITAAWCASAAAPSTSTSSTSATRAPTNCWSRSRPPACARPTCTAATPITRPISRGVRPRGRRHRARDRQRRHDVQARRPRGDGLSLVRRMSRTAARTGKAIACRLRPEDEWHARRRFHAAFKDGKPVYSAFFQQSSFGNFTIANERFAVKVRNDVPLEHALRARLRRPNRRRRRAQCDEAESRRQFCGVRRRRGRPVGADGGEDRRLRSDHRGRRA